MAAETDAIEACRASDSPSALLVDRLTVYAVEVQEDDGSWKIANVWEDEGEANASRFHVLDKQQRLSRLKKLTVIQRSKKKA